MVKCRLDIYRRIPHEVCGKYLRTRLALLCTTATKPPTLFLTVATETSRFSRLVLFTVLSMGLAMVYETVHRSLDIIQ